MASKGSGMRNSAHFVHSFRSNSYSSFGVFVHPNPGAFDVGVSAGPRQDFSDIYVREENRVQTPYRHAKHPRSSSTFPQ